MHNYLARDALMPTATSLLSYFVMSAIISPLGIASGAISDHYGISITSATALFSYLTTGVLIGSFLSILVNPLLGSRRVILLSSAALIGICVLVRWIDAAWCLPAAFVCVGAGCGLLLASAAIVITGIYEERHRASALLATDSFYSFAGFIAVPIAGWAVARSLHWTSMYAVALLATLLLGVTAWLATYPAERARGAESRSGIDVGWPIAAYLVGASLFVYLVSFIFVYAWAPAYASVTFDLAADESGALVGRFFLGLFLGQIAMFFVALRINVRLLLGVIGAGATLVSVGLWASETAAQFGIMLLGLGLVTGGLLKPMIAFGTQVVPSPSSRLVGFYMFCSALGSSVSPVLSAYIVETSSVATVMILITVGFSITYLLLIASMAASRGVDGSSHETGYVSGSERN